MFGKNSIGELREKGKSKSKLIQHPPNNNIFISIFYASYVLFEIQKYICGNDPWLAPDGSTIPSSAPRIVQGKDPKALEILEKRIPPLRGAEGED